MYLLILQLYLYTNIFRLYNERNTFIFVVTLHTAYCNTTTVRKLQPITPTPYNYAPHSSLITIPSTNPSHTIAFNFFVDPTMASFYKRFIRDFVRYRSGIQCAAHDLIQTIKQEAAQQSGTSVYYALHIRRGDLQFKVISI